ncbi:MAG: tetratricopeptide repeat protein [Chloroflexi bacterium]|nr:tetratricopeptide repeat protein [Chloroflexota bacterium]
MRPNLTPPEEPADAEGYNRRGNQYSRNGAYEQAIADYTQALELDANLADAWFNRGCSYYELGMYDASIEDLTRAIEIDPQDDNFYGRRSLAYLFSDRLEEAEADQDLCDEIRNRGG